MKKTAIIIVIFLILSYPSAAQKGSYKAMYDSAMIYFSLENYQHALPVFMRMYEAQPDNANIAYHIGASYLHMPSEKYQAIPYLEKACQKVSKTISQNIDEQNAPVSAFFELGNAYLINYDLAKSIEVTNKYKTFFDPNEKKDQTFLREADRQIAMCNLAREMLKNPVPIKVENLKGKINTIFPEYAPVVDNSGNTLFFTARRNTNMGELIEDNGYYFEDVYYSKKDEKGNWGEAVNVGDKVNTYDHEASISISPDNKQLFIYKDDGGDGNIYISNFTDKEWSVPVKMPSPVNSKAWETHASLSHDGNTLYFTSDRDGGLGGLDIYKATRQANGKWGQVENLGDTINTEYNEEGPFILSNNTLYFCSQGHNTMGGYDIFYSKRTKDGKWTIPVNMGYPINTTDNDMFYTPVDTVTAYFASVRFVDDFDVKGFGNLDIYKLAIHNLKIKGLALDKKTNQPIPGALILLMNDKMAVIDSVTANERGEYSFAVDYNNNYNLKVQKENHIDGYKTVSTYNLGDSKEVTANVVLDKLMLKIQVADAKTQQRLQKVSVQLKDKKSGISELFTTDQTGEIVKDLFDKKINDSLRYELQFTKAGYNPKTLDYKHLIASAEEILIVEKLEKTDPIRIRGVAMDKNTKEILPGTKVILMDNKMAEIDQTITNEKGAFVFDADYDQEYLLKGQKLSYADGDNKVSTPGVGKAKEVTANLLLEKVIYVSLKVQVIDAKNNQPVKDATVSLKDMISGKTELFTSDAKGELFKPVGIKQMNDSLKYELTFSKDEYHTKVSDYNYRITKSEEILIVETIGKMEVGTDLAKIIQIKPIYFDLDKYNIRPDAAVELDKIVKIMNEYPTMVIELGSHTDCRQTYQYNERLSDNRAKSSAAYIQKRISNPERIYGKGYGETQLVNECECEGKKVVPCTEAQHQMNRRTEFIIKKY
ncbi:MAG TPA: OmpA family protein [Bacteroidales bacterium]|nr:OmpA family protein [Bacteroidales bacterium]